MSFVKFYRRHEVNGGTVLQDKEAIILVGSYILLFYPDTGEFLQIDEKIKAYPDADRIGRSEFFGFLGLSRGLMLIIKNMVGISHVKGDNYEDEVEDDNSSFESFFDTTECVDADLRPPVIVGGGYEER